MSPALWRWLSEVHTVHKDVSIIPPGEDCYWVFPIREGEFLSLDADRHSKDLREFLYYGNFRGLWLTKSNVLASASLRKGSI